MNYTRTPIPTEYRGIRFRSRLEATWAAFFDRLGWRWEYEPDNLPGWLPDFALAGARGPVFVEVKPTFELLAKVTGRMHRACPGGDLLLCGLGPWISRPGDYACIGWANEPESEDSWFCPAPLGAWSGSESTAKNPRGTIGFCHEDGSFQDRITGCYDGGTYGGATPDGFEEWILLEWGRAKSGVRYRHPAERSHCTWGTRQAPDSRSPASLAAPSDRAARRGPSCDRLAIGGAP
ncbi:MAG: hypothetical protein JXR96_27005 [Deltaproteobacteria bacterium]|nr:hypothetical protein [Deltaproteobacteria bacterium]